jgi:cytochrome c55X
MHGLLFAGFALAAFPVAAADHDLPGERRGELVALVRQDCGSCHGLTLKGGLGPSLEPPALAGKDVEFLSFVILRGRPGTPMPPWGEHLSEREAIWIAEALKKGFPK